jgi:hypothetical protein
LGLFEWSDLYTPGAALKYARAATDKLGITNPDPEDLSKGPDAARLRDAADTFMGQYKTLTPGVVPGTARGPQGDALAYATAAAKGAVPSAAEAMFRKSTDENVANQLGMAATLQGSRPGLAMRAGLQGAQRAIGASAADAAALRANEMATGRSQLIQAANAMRAGDQGDVGNTLQGRQIDANREANLGRLSLDATKAPYDAAVGAQQNQIRNDAANQSAIGGMLGPAAYLLKSDETTKTDVHASPEMADEFLRSLEPKTYKYKDPSAMGSSPGTHLGVIAQDLAGGTTTGPDGKKWISADVIGRVLAGLGRLNEKVEGQG